MPVVPLRLMHLEVVHQVALRHTSSLVQLSVSSLVSGLEAPLPTLMSPSITILQIPMRAGATPLYQYNVSAPPMILAAAMIPAIPPFSTRRSQTPMAILLIRAWHVWWM